MAKMKDCPVCGIGVKLENLEIHLKKVHPRVNVNAYLSEDDKTEISVAKKKERKTASPFDDRERRRWAIAGIIAVVIVMALVVVMAMAPPGDDGGSVVGEPAPLFIHNDVDNIPYNLNSHIGPRLILLEFFSTECSWCIEMQPNLEELHEYYGYGNQVEIVSISADSDDSFADVRGYRDIHGSNWTFISAPESLAGEYGVTATPTMFLIGYDGIVLEEIVGYKAVGAMKNIINDHL